MKLFKNDTIKIESENAKFAGKTIFKIWELKENAIGETVWIFCGRLAACGYMDAFRKYDEGNCY